MYYPISSSSFVDERLVILRALERMMSTVGSKGIVFTLVGITCLVAKANRGWMLFLWQEDWGMFNFKNYQQVVVKRESANSKLGVFLGIQWMKTYDMLHDLIVGLGKRLRHKESREEYSFASTGLTQQNGVDRRRKKEIGLLIEAARTMLADSLLPIQFWAEAVNTALLYMDDQQFIVHTTQSMPPEERTAAKEVKLSSEDQALHDELVSLMHQESLAKAHNDDQRIAFEEEKRRISIAKGKEHVD
ncbi:hypothetical protein Tco_0464509 [Tanacetum coccineum]